MSKVYAKEVLETLRRKKAMASVPTHSAALGSSPDIGTYVAKIQELVDYAVRNMQAKPQDANGALRDAQSFLRTLRSLVTRSGG